MKSIAQDVGRRPLGDEEIRALKPLVHAAGETAFAASCGLSKNALMRAMAGLSVLASTRVVVRTAISRAA